MLEKMSRLRRSMGKILIKNATLGVPRWKKLKFFPMSSFVCFYSRNVSRSGLISKNFVWLHSSWTTMVGWERKLLGFGHSKQLEHSLFQWFHALKPLYFKAYFVLTWHLESLYTDILKFKHKCTDLFATNLKNKQHTRQEQS